MKKGYKILLFDQAGSKEVVYFRKRKQAEKYGAIKFEAGYSVCPFIQEEMCVENDFNNIFNG